MYKQQLSQDEALLFLLRVGSNQHIHRLRTTSLIVLGGKLVFRSKESVENVANALKNLFCRFENDDFRIELEKLGYNIYTRDGRLKTFNSIISTIRHCGPHPKLIKLFGIHYWHIYEYLF